MTRAVVGLLFFSLSILIYIYMEPTNDVRISYPEPTNADAPKGTKITTLGDIFLSTSEERTV